MANFANVRNMGDPRDPAWSRDNLTTISAPNGQSWQVNRQAAEAFNGLLGDLVKAGYNPVSGGGYNVRNIRGGNTLSQHSWGNAIDINPQSNPMQVGKLSTDMPADIGEIAARHGLEWGGNWKTRPDPMHFEWRGPAVQDAQPTSVASAFAQPQQTAQVILPPVPIVPPNPGPAPGSPPDRLAGMFGPDPWGAALVGAQQVFKGQEEDRQRQEADKARRLALFFGSA